MNIEKSQAWEALKVTLPSALSSIGAFSLSLKEMVLFGGWDTENQKDVYFMKEEKADTFKISTEDECQLENADIFLFTGAVKYDTERNEIIVGG